MVTWGFVAPMRGSLPIVRGGTMPQTLVQPHLGRWDTSTNDAFVMIERARGDGRITRRSKRYVQWRDGVGVGGDLAQAIVRDARARPVHPRARGRGRKSMKGRNVAYAIAHSTGQDRLIRVRPDSDGYVRRSGLPCCDPLEVTIFFLASAVEKGRAPSRYRRPTASA